ncbi:Arm DNA-binding domain-containing protein, partial [Acidovorax facilis]
MGLGINRLTALKVQRLKQPGYHADGAGLYLCVKPSGAKSWIFRYRFAGREREMGLGSLVTFGLADARERALAQRRLLADGKDPLDIKHAAQARQSRADVLVFDTAAARYIASHRAGWKNAKHAEQWTNTLA